MRRSSAGQAVELRARGDKERAGTHVLLMAAEPLSRHILRTMVNKRIMVEMDGGVYDVSPEGREALFVAFVAERWLQSAPQGPLDFDSPEAEAAIRALAEGWHATLIHVLARGPLTFKELRDAVDGVRRAKARRLIAALQGANLIEVLPDADGDALYAVTDWLRAGLAPLVAAARLELRQGTDEAAPIDALDVEAAFRLSLPLLKLPADLSGSCRLGADLDGDDGAVSTGVTAEIDRGVVVACHPGLDEQADAWATGPVEDWLDTVIEPDAKRVRSGGDRRLPAILLSGLHETLFGIPVA